MYRPSIKSKRTLAFLAIIALVLFYISDRSQVEIEAPYHKEKIAAAEEMLGAMKVIQERRAAQGVFPEELGDPLAMILVGQSYSLTTTKEGLLSSKHTALNPNFAAVILDLLKAADVQKGDKIAVGMSGSFPGLNIALLAACKVIGAEPVIISSLGSSAWGANEDDFTWLDIEKTLRDAEVFPYKSVAASIGGGEDAGSGLSKKGRQLLRDAAVRCETPMIEAETLQKSIAERMRIFGAPSSYKAYVNIGGGIASLGHTANADLIEPGFHHRLKPLNYPGIGVINLFGKETAVIQLQNVEILRRRYDLPLAPSPLPPVGIGKVFSEPRYDLRVTVASLALIFFLLAGVFRLDKAVFRLSDKGADPDSL
jgi:poly-gamma-glutamate system protein